MKKFYTALAFLFLFGVAEYAQSAVSRTIPHDHTTRGKGGDLGEVDFTCLRFDGNCVLRPSGGAFAGVRVQDDLATSGEAVTFILFRDETNTQSIAGIVADELSQEFRLLNNGSQEAIVMHLNGEVQLMWNDVEKLVTAVNGINVTGTTMLLDPGTASISRFVVINNNHGAALTITAASTSATLDQTSSNGTVEEAWVTMAKNGAVSLGNNGTIVTRTVTAANGGLQINNTSTGGGFERVLTTADLGVAGDFLIASIAADTAIADATLATCLTVTTAANTNYSVEAHIAVSSPVSDDFNIKFILPTSALSVGIGQNIDNTNMGWVDEGTTTYQTNNSREGIFMQGMLTTEANAGAFTLQCAKNADAGADATLFEGSWLRLQAM